MNETDSAVEKSELTGNQLLGRLARAPDGTTGEIVDVEEPVDGERRVVLDPFDGEFGKNVALDRVEVGE